MRDPQAVARALEIGLGGLRAFESFRPDMRLRMSGVCGLASIAIAEHLSGTRLLLTRPQLSVDEDLTHLFVVTPTQSGEMIIDTSYTYLLCYAGLTPGYIAHGGPDHYPNDKIAVFPAGDSSRVVNQLTRHARIALDTYAAPADRYYNSRREFNGMTDEQIADEYEKVWELANCEEWQPSDRMLAQGQAIAEYINPHDVQLVD